MSQRRLGTEGSASRSALLDAAQELMIEEGYAAISSRKVAARAGLKPQLVHYYFRTMDDLYLAVFERVADEGLRRLERVTDAEQPLWALWKLNSHPAGTTLMVELTALGNHRKELQSAIAEYAGRFRRRQVEVVEQAFERQGVLDPSVGALEAAVLMTSVSRFLSMEHSVGIDDGHDQVRALAEHWLTVAEGPYRGR